MSDPEAPGVQLLVPPQDVSVRFVMESTATMQGTS